MNGRDMENSDQFIDVSEGVVFENMISVYEYTIQNLVCIYIRKERNHCI